MEAQPGVPVARGREPDVVVSRVRVVYVFHPMTLRAQAWLARNVPSEYYADGHVVVPPMKAAQLVLWMRLEDMVVG